MTCLRLFIPSIVSIDLWIFIKFHHDESPSFCFLETSFFSSLQPTVILFQCRSEALLGLSIRIQLGSLEKQEIHLAY